MDKNITARKRSEAVLKALSARQEAILSAIPDIIMEVDNDKVYTWANQAGIDFFGEDVIGKEAAFYFEGEQDTYQTVLPVFAGSEKVIYVESWQRRRDGQKRLLAWRCQTLKDEFGNIKGALSIASDITESKRAEEALRESEEKYRTLVENAAESILIAQDGRLKFVNRMASEITGYSEQELRSSPFLEFVHPDDRNMVGERYLRRLKGDASQPRYAFRLIVKDGSIKWVEIEAVLVAWEGKPATLNFLIDITERKKTEDKLRETLGGLRNALGGIIQVLSATTEKRDPYTAGHQRRVADLARAIGQEMGLAADRVEGLRIAGVIHDIGKVSIPAEILSKPTRLTEIEYKLIQTHSQVGHDILENIDFAWPIAKMILQHHERINGSGYPNQLKDDEILLEARILAVSDIVEAMASHRPYRPSLGIEAALEEIEKNKGILYDPDVASACLTLFREKGFTLK